MAHVHVYNADLSHHGTNCTQSDHDRLPERIIVGTESFPDASYEMWSEVWSMPWVIGTCMVTPNSPILADAGAAL